MLSVIDFLDQHNFHRWVVSIRLQVQYLSSRFGLLKFVCFPVSFCFRSLVLLQYKEFVIPRLTLCISSGLSHFVYHNFD